MTHWVRFFNPLIKPEMASLRKKKLAVPL